MVAYSPGNRRRKKPRMNMSAVVRDINMLSW